MMQDNETIGSAARKAPLLTQEREIQLAKAWLDNGDEKARDVLFRSHLRLVVRIVNKIRNRGSFDDMIADGCLGLLHAIDKFDPDSGYRLSTYSTFWIKSYATEGAFKGFGDVRMPRSTPFKKAMVGLVDIRRKMEIVHDRRLTARETEHAAQALGVTTYAVELADIRYCGMQTSANALMKGGDGEDRQLQDMFLSSEPSPHAILERTQRESWASETVNRLMADLTPRERDIYVRRELMGELTLEEMGTIYGVSRERIRQIQEKVKAKVAKRAAQYRNIAAAHLQGVDDSMAA